MIKVWRYSNTGFQSFIQNYHLTQQKEHINHLKLLQDEKLEQINKGYVIFDMMVRMYGNGSVENLKKWLDAEIEEMSKGLTLFEKFKEGCFVFVGERPKTKDKEFFLNHLENKNIPLYYGELPDNDYKVFLTGGTSIKEKDFININSLPSSQDVYMPKNVLEELVSIKQVSY